MPILARQPAYAAHINRDEKSMATFELDLHNSVVFGENGLAKAIVSYCSGKFLRTFNPNTTYYRMVCVKVQGSRQPRSRVGKGSCKKMAEKSAYAFRDSTKGWDDPGWNEVSSTLRQFADLAKEI